LDVEGHGYLHFREYVLGVTLINSGTKEGIDSSLRLAFRCLDDEGKGGLDCQGLEKILRMGYGDSLTVEQAEKLFKEADKARNGIVTVDEFIEFAHNHEGGE
jgi:Ca2+-binding EF-hand superfamily protein